MNITTSIYIDTSINKMLLAQSLSITLRKEIGSIEIYISWYDISILSSISLSNFTQGCYWQAQSRPVSHTINMVQTAVQCDDWICQHDDSITFILTNKKVNWWRKWPPNRYRLPSWWGYQPLLQCWLNAFPFCSREIFN